MRTRYVGAMDRVCMRMSVVMGDGGRRVTLNKLKKPRATTSMAPLFLNLLSSSLLLYILHIPLYQPIMNIMEYFDEEQDQDGNRTPPLLSPSLLPQDEVPEVSMVEQEDVTGVTFTPEYVSSWT